MIYLAEAVKLKSILHKKFQELFRERRRVAFVTIEKGQQAVRDGLTIEQVEKQLEVIRKDIRTLDRLVYEANVVHTVAFQQQTLTLVEAIEYAKQLRIEVEELKDLAMMEKEEPQFGYGDHATIVRVALYDPEHYRQQADLLERQAHKLSNLINAKNYEVQIDFDDRNYL